MARLLRLCEYLGRYEGLAHSSPLSQRAVRLSHPQELWWSGTVVCEWSRGLRRSRRPPLAMCASAPPPPEPPHVVRLRACPPGECDRHRVPSDRTHGALGFRRRGPRRAGKCTRETDPRPSSQELSTTHKPWCANRRHNPFTSTQTRCQIIRGGEAEWSLTSFGWHSGPSGGNARWARCRQSLAGESASHDLPIDLRCLKRDVPRPFVLTPKRTLMRGDGGGRWRTT